MGDSFGHIYRERDIVGFYVRLCNVCSLTVLTQHFLSFFFLLSYSLLYALRRFASLLVRALPQSGCGITIYTPRPAIYSTYLPTYPLIIAGRHTHTYTPMAPRLHFRGGPWTNTEDQILLAALSSGNRDWERVASNLRKTAAQCRERWESFLDPRLNLQEAWSTAEDSTLMELFLLFPHRWKLIAGQLTKTHGLLRPAWLCEQRYHALKGIPSGEATESGPNSGGVQQQPPGSAHRVTASLSHEERPARQDTVAGDIGGGDAQQTLDIVVSRLANQDQKKGLRKERSRLLEESSFQAKLQSHREAVESGTTTARQRKRMRKALDEDTVGREGGGDGSSSSSDDEGSSGGAQRFQVVDVALDEKASGVHSRQRRLVWDGNSGASKEGKDTVSGGEASRVRLEEGPSGFLQLAAPPAAVNKGETPLLHSLVTSSSNGEVSSIAGGGALTWDTLASGKKPASPSTNDHAMFDLDAVFGRLSDISPGGGTSASLPSQCRDATTTAVASSPCTQVETKGVPATTGVQRGVPSSSSLPSAAAFTSPSSAPPVSHRTDDYFQRRAEELVEDELQEMTVLPPGIVVEAADGDGGWRSVPCDVEELRAAVAAARTPSNDSAAKHLEGQYRRLSTLLRCAGFVDETLRRELLRWTSVDVEDSNSWSQSQATATPGGNGSTSFTVEEVLMHISQQWRRSMKAAVQSHQRLKHEIEEDRAVMQRRWATLAEWYAAELKEEAVWQAKYAASTAAVAAVP